MELNFLFIVIDKAIRKKLEKLLHREALPVVLATPARGTATRRQLRYYGLEESEKIVVMTVADGEKTRDAFRSAKRELMIDIPGNGVMLAIPVKSVGGGKTLAYLTKNAAIDKSMPEMRFDYELIMAILNRGYTDDVMDTAREAGAQGGTVIHAKGTGAAYAKKFFGVSLAEEKELILILAMSGAKSSIMRAIAEKNGPQTEAGTICLSLPVSEVAGIRRMEE